VNTSIIPRENNAYDIGSENYVWRLLYLATGKGGDNRGIYLNDYGAHVISAPSALDRLEFYREWDGRWGFFNRTRDEWLWFVEQTGTMHAEHIIPMDDNAYDLGEDSLKWRNIHAKNLYAYGTLYTDTIRQRSSAKKIESTDYTALPPFRENALAFRKPYKVEVWDGTQWVDVTGDRDWGVLTDNKPSTAVHMSNYTYNTDYFKIRLYYDMGGAWVTPATMLYLVVNHLKYIDYIKVEKSSDPTFATDITTLAEVTEQLSVFDGCIRVPTSTISGKQYIRIEIDGHRKPGTTFTMRIREIMYMSLSFLGGSRGTASYIPIDWDTNWNILPMSGYTQNLGIDTRKWNSVYAVNIYGDTIYEGGMALTDKYAPKSHTHTRDEITDFWNTPFWDNIPDKPSTFPPEAHASSHGKGGSDEVSIDASQVTSGVFDTSRIPDLPRSKITDFFSSPFWDNIPDKPSTFPPEAHTHTRSEITDFWNTPFWDNIPDKPSKYPPEAHTHTRSEITDFWSTPFWDNIPDKPSTYPPSSHTHTRDEISDFWNSPFWNNIPDKPSTYPPEPHASTHRPGGTDPLFPVNHDIDPSTDNTYKLGNSSSRWSEVHAVKVYASTLVRVGDLLFANGWRFTEDYRHGLVLVSPSGKKYRLVLEEVGE